jgi:hypothetical protein
MPGDTVKYCPLCNSTKVRKRKYTANTYYCDCCHKQIPAPKLRQRGKKLCNKMGDEHE